MTGDKLTELAKRYAEAWCRRPEKVSAFFAENGSLKVNHGAHAVGRTAIAEIARDFMRDLPNMIVTLDKLEPRGEATAFHWTLIGTNTGPAGMGNRVRIGGYEFWKIDNDGLISESKGRFDAVEYERQLKHGVA